MTVAHHPRGIAGRNPCPDCGRRPQLLAGPVVFPDNKEAAGFMFLVCWACGAIRKVANGEPWKWMNVPRQNRRDA